jgi:L-ribulose-5-phosphate 3-epimerase
MPAGLALAQGRKELKLGVTDWNLRKASNLDAVALAASIGFEGVEVSLGRNATDGRLPLADPALQEKYLAAAREHKIAIAGTCLDILHVNYLKDDKLGRKWVADGIPITRRLNAGVMLLPFFGKGAITNAAERDAVAGALKELLPEAERAGVTLGLENTLSAEDNVRLMDRAGNSRALLVYYDVGNSTNGGYDILSEMRWLGAARICQVHIKDNPHYLGEGKIDLPAVFRVMHEIGYSGFANLETDSPSRSIPDDMRRNLRYAQELRKKHYG